MGRMAEHAAPARSSVLSCPGWSALGLDSVRVASAVAVDELGADRVDSVARGQWARAPRLRGPPGLLDVKLI